MSVSIAKGLAAKPLAAKRYGFLAVQAWLETNKQQRTQPIGRPARFALAFLETGVLKLIAQFIHPCLPDMNSVQETPKCVQGRQQHKVCD